MKEIKEAINTWSKLLPVNGNVSYSESENRAGEFLSAMAQITEWKHLLNEEKIKYLTVQTATYAEEMSKGTCKTMSENKLNAEATPAYTKSREDLERIDNDISYLRAFYEVFSNAHIFYRNKSKNEGF